MNPPFRSNQLQQLLAEPSRWRVVVVGGGKSGETAVRFLHRLGFQVCLSDSAPASEMDNAFASWLRNSEIRWESGSHTSATFLESHLIIVSPGVPLDIPCLEEARSAGIPIIGEMGFASLFLNLPVIAVTGTNGKTTVTNMLASLFKAAGKKVFVGGNIGRPLTEYLLESYDGAVMRGWADFAVLEVSSYQLETAGGFRPDIGILLNISPDHLDRYDSYNSYAEAKLLLFANQQRGDKVLLNMDDPEILRFVDVSSVRGEKYILERCPGRRNSACWRKDEVRLFLGDQAEHYWLPELLQTSPNRENAAAAVLASRLAGCPPEAVVDGLSSFRPPPHRISLVAEIDGVIFYDDSKATNIGAVQSALAGMERPVILIAGGRDKGGDYGLLAPLVREKVKLLVLTGEAGEKIAGALDDQVDIQMAGDMEEAVCRAVEAAVPGDAVLLSPACSSFDMYKGYAERGLHFQEIVRRMLKN